MLEILTAQNVPVKLCKTCTDGRGITGLPLIDGVEIGTLVELAEWTLDADKVLTFNNKPVKILFSYGRGFSIKFTCGLPIGMETTQQVFHYVQIDSCSHHCRDDRLRSSPFFNTVINFGHAPG